MGLEIEVIDERETRWRPARVAFTFFEVMLLGILLMAMASILFPVYAGSNRSKAATALSNAKQTSLAILMYSNDYDNCFVIAGQWNSSDPDAHQEYSDSPYMPWTGLVEPYLRNRDVLVSPMTGGTRPFVGPGANECLSMRSCNLLYPTYGYNGSYLSPSIVRKDGPAHIQGLSTVNVGRPNEQIMLTEIWSRNQTLYGATSSGSNNAYINFATAEAPDAATDLVPGRPFGRVSWGDYSNRFNVLLQTRTEGLYTAGVAFRYHDRTPVCFADGHVKSMTAEQLAVGTDWYPGLDGKARNLHNDGYLWDPRNP